MMCLIVCVYVQLWGSWQNLQGRDINQLYSSGCNTFHCKKPQMPLPLGNLSVCHVEGFSPQKTRLDKQQRQLDSILPGLECPRGQELSISLATHFKITAFPPLLSLPLPSPSLFFLPLLAFWLEGLFLKNAHMIVLDPSCNFHPQKVLDPGLLLEMLPPCS